MKVRLRLSYVFILINSVILSLPIAGIALMKLYDSTLIRQTEHALITQAVLLANIYTKQLKDQYPSLIIEGYGKPLPDKFWPINDPVLGKWHPIIPTLDLNKSPIYPQEKSPQKTDLTADPIALEIGRGFDKLLKEVQLTTLSGMRIVDINGIIVSSTSRVKEKSILDRIEVAKALEGEVTRVIRKWTNINESRFFSPISRTSDIRIHVAYPIVLENRIIGAIHLIRTPANVFQQIYQNKNLFISYGILIIALNLTISFFTAYAITRPIKALVAQAKKAMHGTDKPLTVLKHPVTIEFELLSETLVKMSNKQIQRAEQIKNFASYVSHEFKTPITAIKGAVEILQDHIHNLSEDEQVKFLHNIDTNSNRMLLLMRQLTELANADIQKIPNTPCDLTHIINEQAKIYQDKLTNIHINKSTATFLVYMNRELLTSIVSNLFNNVIQHGGDIVTIELTKEKHQLHLTFSDNGKGITEQNAKRIFEPFFTTAKQSGGTGLGLAIISTLLTAHKGEINLITKINLENPNVNGCKLRLSFPV
ncbi:MAG: HAMP domain-containing sensor histidine kinase [Colwellia sp.]